MQQCSASQTSSFPHLHGRTRLEELDILCSLLISYTHLVELLGSLPFIFSILFAGHVYCPKGVDGNALSFKEMFGILWVYSDGSMKTSLQLLAYFVVLTDFIDQCIFLVMNPFYPY